VGDSDGSDGSENPSTVIKLVIYKLRHTREERSCGGSRKIAAIAAIAAKVILGFFSKF